MKKTNAKKNYVKRITAAAILGIVLVISAGCGSKLYAEDPQINRMSYAVPQAAASSSDIYMDSGGGMNTAGMMDGTVTEEAKAVESEQAEVNVADGRKLIKTVNMNVETDDVASLLPVMEQKVGELGGYMESLSSGNNGYYSNYSGKMASFTARIPADRLDQFVSILENASNVTNRNEYVEDVTLSYVDLESRKKMLTTEQERLLELLEQAESLEDIITLESHLSQVRYQLESMESQLRTYDNRIDYSTVYVYIQEVEHFTPAREKGTWERITTGFAESLYKVGSGFKNFGIGLIVSIPYIVIIAVLAAAGVLIIRMAVKHRKRKVKRKIEGDIGNKGE